MRKAILPSTWRAIVAMLIIITRIITTVDKPAVVVSVPQDRLVCARLYYSSSHTPRDIVCQGTDPNRSGWVNLLLCFGFFCRSKAALNGSSQQANKS